MEYIPIILLALILFAIIVLLLTMRNFIKVFLSEMKELKVQSEKNANAIIHKNDEGNQKLITTLNEVTKLE